MKKYKINDSSVQDLDFAANISVKVSDSRNILRLDLTGAATVALDPESTPVPGDEIIIKATSDATARDITFGAGFTAPVLAGVIGKTKVQTLVYDGETFVAAGAPVQID